MKKGKRLKSFAYSIGTGIFAVFLFLLIYMAANKNTAPFMLILREVLPLYDNGLAPAISLYTYGGYYENVEPELLASETKPSTNDIEPVPVFELSPEVAQEEPSAEQQAEQQAEIIGISNVIYQPGTDMGINNNPQGELLTKADLEKFSDFDYLKSALYTVDKRTALLPSDININEFLSMDFKTHNDTNGPKALIFHTHSQEGYSNSRENDLTDGVYAVGDRLAELLENKYGIKTLHDKSSYDIVNGKPSTLGAYERMEVSIAEILEKNPSIELVIDLHRDGVAENIHFATEINGKPTAKIMFFNGLCRVFEGGELTPTNDLSNPYVNENLAFSFNLQLIANELYPNFTRKIYINAYRYSLHFKPKSILVEVGAQTNTKEEALNAMEPLAEIIAKAVK